MLALCVGLSPASDVVSVHFVQDVCANLAMNINVRRVANCVRSVFASHNLDVQTSSVAALIDNWAEDPHANVLLSMDPCLPAGDRWSADGVCKIERKEDGDIAGSHDSRHRYFTEFGEACQRSPVRHFHTPGAESSHPWVVAWPSPLQRLAVEQFRRCVAAACAGQGVGAWREEAHTKVEALAAALETCPSWATAEGFAHLRVFPHDHWDNLGRRLRGLAQKETPEDMHKEVSMLSQALNDWCTRGASAVSGALDMQTKVNTARQVLDTAQFIMGSRPEVWDGHRSAVQLCHEFHVQLAKAGPLVGELWEFFCYDVLGFHPYLFADGHSGALSCDHT